MKPNHMELMNPSQNALIQWSKREVRVVVRPFWVARQKWFLSHRLLTDYSNKIHPDLSPPALTKAPLSGILFAMEELSHVSSRLTTRVICIILIGSIASRPQTWDITIFFTAFSQCFFFQPHNQLTMWPFQTCLKFSKRRKLYLVSVGLQLLLDGNLRFTLNPRLSPLHCQTGWPWDGHPPKSLALRVVFKIRDLATMIHYKPIIDPLHCSFLKGFPGT